MVIFPSDLQLAAMRGTQEALRDDGRTLAGLRAMFAERDEVVHLKRYR